MIIVDLDVMMKWLEMNVEKQRQANERYMETLRKRAFPTPSRFGVEWEKQRVFEAYTMIARRLEGRKVTPQELMVLSDESLRIMLVALDRHVSTGRLPTVFRPS